MKKLARPSGLLRTMRVIRREEFYNPFPESCAIRADEYQ